MIDKANANLERVEFYNSRGGLLAIRSVPVTRGLSSTPWITGRTVNSGTYHRSLLKSHEGAWVIWLNDGELVPLGAVVS